MDAIIANWWTIFFIFIFEDPIPNKGIETTFIYVDIKTDFSVSKNRVDIYLLRVDLSSIKL